MSHSFNIASSKEAIGTEVYIWNVCVSQNVYLTSTRSPTASGAMDTNDSAPVLLFPGKTVLLFPGKTGRVRAVLHVLCPETRRAATAAEENASARLHTSASTSSNAARGSMLQEGHKLSTSFMCTPIKKKTVTEK